jgi:hypothetical protein
VYLPCIRNGECGRLAGEALFLPSPPSVLRGQDFLFSIKAGDVEHAVEMLSPDVYVVADESGEMIGLAAAEYFLLLRELSRCGIDDEYPKGQLLWNGAFVKVINRGRVSLVPAEFLSRGTTQGTC